MSLCLIIDDMHPSLLPMLRSIGVEGDYQPKLTAADVPAALAARPYQGLMVRRGRAPSVACSSAYQPGLGQRLNAATLTRSSGA